VGYTAAAGGEFGESFCASVRRKIFKNLQKSIAFLQKTKTGVYPTPETLEQWKDEIIEMDAKVKSGEVKIKSVREQFAEHGYNF